MTAAGVISAPTRGHRVAAATVKEVARQIVERFDPQRIILFGTNAYGQPGTASDVDLLVIMETPSPHGNTRHDTVY